MDQIETKLSPCDPEKYNGIDYSSILLANVIFPQYQMIENSTELSSELSINAKGYRFVQDPLFILIDEHQIRYIINVHHNNLTARIENLMNILDEYTTLVRSNKLLNSWIQQLPSNGLYIFEIIVYNQLLNITDCYLFNNIYIGNHLYLWRLTIINKKLTHYTNVVISKPYPDFDLEEKISISKKNNIIVKVLQFNAIQRFDYIVGGNRYNIAPYKFAIIGCHVDRSNKRRYIVLARHCGAFQICSLIKLPFGKANTINEFSAIDDRNIILNSFSQFCWCCKYPTDGTINYYQIPLIVSCNIRRTGYISILGVSKNQIQSFESVERLRNVLKKSVCADDRRIISDKFIHAKMNELTKSYTMWLLQNIDEYPAILNVSNKYIDLPAHNSNINIHFGKKRKINYS